MMRAVATAAGGKVGVVCGGQRGREWSQAEEEQESQGKGAPHAIDGTRT